MDFQLEKAAKLFKALSDPKRLAILAQLRSGEKCACMLQELMALTQSGLSYHMKILCASGLVTAREDGRWIHYRLNPEGQAAAVRLLLEYTTPDSVQLENLCARPDADCCQ